MYRGFDFKQVEHVMLHEMNWTWMLLSFPFGIMAQVFRGWRWRQTLDPMGEKPRAATAIHAVFVSYAVSLVIPRIGEFARCAVLRRYDKTDFAKALKIEENIGNWIEKITDKTAKNIDFGLINGKTVFLSSYAGGLFTKISA